MIAIDMNKCPLDGKHFTLPDIKQIHKNLCLSSVLLLSVTPNSAVIRFDIYNTNLSGQEEDWKYV